MSGICGIVNFDGSPVDPDVLRAMTEAVAYRGPDGIHYWIEGNVGFAHLALHTTPEALRERQPLVNRRGDLVLTADARVDNHPELISTLTAKGYIEDKDPTDADLILAAYDCWGEACPEHIIGDFAFAVWDKRERKLFCARDTSGLRSFFYCRRGQTFYFATAISSILAVLDPAPPLNDYLIADFLCWRFDRWIHETVYRTIFRVPACYSYEVRQEEAHFNHYWTLGAQPRLTYKKDTEYLDHFRELFSEAICSRLRSTTPVGISVSGGLDSSSIACMIDHIYSNGGSCPQPEIQLYAYAFKDFSKADEREYLQAVLDKCQRFPAIVIPGENVWGLKDVNIPGRHFHLDEPAIFPMSCMLVELLQKAQQHGCRIVITGEGGDQIMNAAAYWNPNLFFDVSPWRMGSELKYFWKRNRWSMFRSVLELVRPIIKPLIPSYFIERRRLARQARPIPSPEWVNKKWLAHLGENEDQDNFTVAHYSDLRHLPTRSAVVMYRQLTGGWYAALLSYLNALSGQVGVEYRLPFLDRRLVDFMLVVPAQFRFTDGLTKIMLRQAMLGILPEEVRQRTTRAYYNQVADNGLREKERAKVRSLLNDVPTKQSKYVWDMEKLSSAWKVYCDGNARPSFTLIATLLLQSWLGQTFNS